MDLFAEKLTWQFNPTTLKAEAHQAIAHHPQQKYIRIIQSSAQYDFPGEILLNEILLHK